MSKVTITSGEREADLERKVMLNNGDLVLFHKEDTVKSYLVTSFRNSKDNRRWDSTSKYCSFVDLETGYLAFEEPCSRNTTQKRILSHLNNCCNYAGQHNFHYDYGKIGKSYTKEYKSGEYSINLVLHK